VSAFPPLVRLIRPSNGDPAAPAQSGCRRGQRGTGSPAGCDDRWLPQKLETQLECAADANYGHLTLKICCRDALGEPARGAVAQNNVATSFSAHSQGAHLEALGGFDENRELIGVGITTSGSGSRPLVGI